jgi:hypothetical protein
MFRLNTLTERDFRLGRREFTGQVVVGYSSGFRMYFVRRDGQRIEWFKGIHAARAAAARKQVYA